MPTESHPNVLYRELAVVQVKELKPSPTTLLQEVVNFGTHAFVRCMSNTKGEENVHLAPFALFRHILELTDGIEILISNASPSTAVPLLRSSYEALLSLEYILEDSEKYERRSLSWLVGHVRQKIRTYRSFIATVNEGKEFLKAIEEDKNVRDFPFPPKDQITDSIKNLEELLSRDQFVEIINEINRCGRENWYSLFGGPRKLKDLAYYMGRPAQHDFLYSQWSISVHAKDFSPFLFPARIGDVEIRGLRDISTLPRVITFSVTFLIAATRLLINKFHPGEDWGNWYFREIREAYTHFAKHQATK